jgi:hypothetical protein
MDSPLIMKERTIDGSINIADSLDSFKNSIAEKNFEYLKQLMSEEKQLEFEE